MIDLTEEESAMINKYKDYGIKVGDQINKWTVLEGIKVMKDKYNKWICVLCRCNCEYQTERYVKNADLYHNRIKGCKKCALKKYNKYDLFNNYGVGYTLKNEKFYFDLDDYEKIKNILWSYNKGRIEGRAFKDYRQIAIHRFILNINDKNIMLDHIDRNPLNNMKKNLRIVTHLENSINKSITKRNKSGFIGVRFCKREKKWVVQLTYNGKTMSFGGHNDKKNAIIARLKAELKYFGNEFAPQRHLFEEYGISVDSNE